MGGIVSFGRRLALMVERISEPFIRLLDLPFALFRTPRRLERAVRLEQHPVTRGLELVAGSLKRFEAIECRTLGPLDLSQLLKREG